MLRVVLASAPVAFALYAVTVAVANRLGPYEAIGGAAANTIPLLMFGAPAYVLARDRISGRAARFQIVAHLALGAAFALLSFWLLLVLLGLLDGVSVTEFTVRPFPVRGMAWQLLENVTTYGVIALLAQLHSERREPDSRLLDAQPTSGSAAGSGAGPSRYFIRSGDDLKPIDIERIVSIAGADDYAEVRTTVGRHLVRMTLAEFEKTLDPARFIRIHRSRIVNVERIARAEPAGGGRMLLHMEDGEMIQASRAGSRLLRDRVI